MRRTDTEGPLEMDWYDENDMWFKAMRSYLNDDPTIRQTQLLEAFSRNLTRRGDRKDGDGALHADRLRFLTELLIAEQDGGSDVPTLTQRVALLAEGGLTFAQAQEVFSARQDPELAEVIGQARDLFVLPADDVAIDEAPVVRPDAGGAWVSAWVFVPAAEPEPAAGHDDVEEEDDAVEEDDEDA